MPVIARMISNRWLTYKNNSRVMLHGIALLSIIAKTYWSIDDSLKISEGWPDGGRGTAFPLH